MESAPQSVLSYASVNAGSAEVPMAMDLTFERPSVTQETILYAVALGFCCVGLTFVAILFLSIFLDEYVPRDRNSKLIASGIAFAVITGIALPMTLSMLRLRRFGDAPVRIVLDEGIVTLSDPVRLGPKPLTLPLIGLRACATVRRSFEGDRYAIYFVENGSWRRKRIDVAVHEHGIVERAAADLQRAIDRANGKN